MQTLSGQSTSETEPISENTEQTHPSDHSENLKKRFSRSILWATIGSVISQGSVYACSIIIARILGRELFGQLAIIQSTITMLGSIAGLGLGITATKYVSELRKIDLARCGRILGLCSIITTIMSASFALILVLFAPFITTYTFKAPHLAGEIRLSSIYIFFFTINAYQIGTFMGFEQFSKIAKINLIQSITSVIITISLTYLYKLNGAALSLGLSAMTCWFYYHINIRKECSDKGIKIDYINAWSERSVLVTFAFPAAISGIIGATSVWISNTLLIRSPQGFSAMGLYNAANTLKMLVLYIPSIVTRVASPILCNLKSSNSDALFQKTFWTNLKLNTLASIVMAVFIAVFAPTLLKMFGREFTGGQLITAVLLTAGVIEVAATSLYQVLFSHGKMWWQLIVIIPWSLALIITTLVFVPKYGSLALAFGYLLASTCSASLYFVMARKLLYSKVAPKGHEEVYHA